MSDFGPTSFETTPAAGEPQRNLRAWADIDLRAVVENVGRMREVAPNADVMAVVKADAYGHGLIEVSRAARSGGAKWLGVALLQEALDLRAAGDQGPLFAWLATPGDQFAACVKADIDLNVSAAWMLTEVVVAAKSLNKAARIHLKIDTGLGRGGSTPHEWSTLIKASAAAAARGEVEIVGIWSHFAYADSPNHPTIARQLEAFEDAIEVARRLGVEPKLRHIANSAATLTLPTAHYDLVRPGIAIYGISPGDQVGTSRSLGLRPVMTLGASLVQVKRLPAGHGISYGHEYVTDRETTVALVPVGYADGIDRSATNAGPVLAAGRVRPIAGRVCMDQFVLDLGDDLAVAGDEVLLFGSGSRGEPSAADWARVCDTIPYEIVTRIGPRVQRVFRGGV